VNGDDHEAIDNRGLLRLLEGVNDQMTGIEVKYVTMVLLLAPITSPTGNPLNPATATR
jgi:hypothetical protein